MRKLFRGQAVGMLLLLFSLPLPAAGLQSGVADAIEVPTGVIAGIVLDQTGAVISAAQVTVTEESTARMYSAKTNNSGLYQIPALAPGKYTVRCAMQQFKTETKSSVVVNAGQVLQLNFQLAVGAHEDFEIRPGFRGPVIVEPQVEIDRCRTCEMAGTVLDPMGMPIPQARVTLMSEARGTRYQTATSCSGRYQVHQLQAGTYTVHIEANAFRPQTKTGILVNEAQVMRLGVVLEVAAFAGSEIEGGERMRTGAIMGTVKDSSGVAVPATITARKTTGAQFEATTDVNGVFSFFGLLAGSYEVSSVAGGSEVGPHQQALVQPSGIACLDFPSGVEAGAQLPSEPSAGPKDTAGVITGYVIDPSGAVIPGAQVTVTDESTAKVHSARTNDSGVYRVSPLTPGKYTVRVECQGFRTETKTSVVISASKTTVVHVRLMIGGGGPHVEIEPAPKPGASAWDTAGGAIAGSNARPVTA